MYKIYLKTYDQRGRSNVLKNTQTTTPSPAAAEVAFRELLSKSELNGTKSHAVLSLDSRQLMYHRFDRNSGENDYVDPACEIKLFHD